MTTSRVPIASLILAGLGGALLAVAALDLLRIAFDGAGPGHLARDLPVSFIARLTAWLGLAGVALVIGALARPTWRDLRLVAVVLASAVVTSAIVAELVSATLGGAQP